MSQIPIYCINLDQRKDRWKKCKDQFGKQKINVKRFSAIKNTEYPYLGVAQSHKKIIEISFQKNHSLVCVLEDDVEISNNFIEKINKIISSTPKDWHIIYLWGGINRNATIKKINKSVSRVDNITGGYGIIYSKKCFGNFIQAVEDNGEFKGFKTFDAWLAYDYQKKYPCYVSNSLLVKHLPGYSDIEKKERNTTRKHIIRFWLYTHGFWIIMKWCWIMGDILNLSDRKNAVRRK